MTRLELWLLAECGVVLNAARGLHTAVLYAREQPNGLGKAKVSRRLCRALWVQLSKIEAVIELVRRELEEVMAQDDAARGRR